MSRQVNFHRYNGGTGALNAAADVASVALPVYGVILYAVWLTIKYTFWPLWGPFNLYARHRRKRAITPIERTCQRCHAPRHHRCVMWDGYGWRPLPYPHYERTLP